MCAQAAVLQVPSDAWVTIRADAPGAMNVRTRNSELTMGTGLFLTLPALFLTPAFLPKPLLPDWLQTVTKVNPATYVIEPDNGS